MLEYIRIADAISAWFGKAFAWCILIMTFGVGYEVFVRYVLRDPTVWSFDLTLIMYGSLFMIGGAYTLSRDGHVRGDFLYRLWGPRYQATVEFVLYFLFFFPGILALIFAGWKYAARSWRYQEVSVMSPANVPIFQFKTVIVVAGVLMLIQGVAQVLRCVVCMKTGQWPKHSGDIEEMEDVLLREARERADAEEARAVAAEAAKK